MTFFKSPFCVIASGVFRRKLPLNADKMAAIGCFKRVIHL